MLYVTTRNKIDTYTAHNTISNHRTPDGAAFVPIRLPQLSVDQIAELKDKSFSKCVADILNLFFSVNLDAADVEFCIGRTPVKLAAMSHKITVAEAWHCPEQDFAQIVRNLHVRMGADPVMHPSEWMRIAVCIAVLFGTYGQMLHNRNLDEGQSFDIAVSAGDFTVPMAAWYCREMGLPIATVVCGCNSDSCVWDLLHHGEMRTGDSVPVNLERLIYGTLGIEKTEQFAAACEKNRIFALCEEEANTLCRGMFAAVISEKRIHTVIRQVYQTNKYMLAPNGSTAYAGLQDYRAGAGETRSALIFTEHGPRVAADAIAAAMGISGGGLRNLANLN